MMRQFIRLSLAGLATLAAVACSDSTATSSSPSLDSSALSAALSSVPLGYGELASSFVGSPASDAMLAGLWVGGGRDAEFDRGGAHGGLMGGGLDASFTGGIPFDGRGGHHGPFSGPFGGGLGCTGTFDAASGRVVCADVTRNGITVKRSAQYKDAAGAVQQAFDTATTNSLNTQSSTSGTITFDRAADSASDGDDHGDHHWGRGRGPGGRLLGDSSTILTATTTISSSSTRTVTGLAAAATQRTVNGASAGTESTTGTSTRGSFTATRVVGDTTTGIVIPIVTGTRSYPTAGTTIRSIKATLTYTGASPVSLTRREVVTYDGSATAKVEITENGTTKSCTRPLPRGALSCS
ncbi:MAG TPA: hypothetical protein VGP25_18125 [Gemmatimonadaceae bacterium]|jgi:hypothetical protein|nr:hypothetical protein [Gemmatimonadaceae bacterium]